MFEFKLPDLGEGIHEGELIQWFVSVGDNVNEDDPLCEIETDKAAVTIPSPRTGTIAACNAKPGDIIATGSTLVVIDEEGNSDVSGTVPVEKSAEPEKEPSAQPSAEPSKHPAEDRPVKKAIAAPATRRLAREMGIDINEVSGSGPGGRVTKEDLAAFKTGKNVTQPEPEPASTDQARAGVPFAPDSAGSIPFFEISPLPDYSKTGPVEREPIRSLRKKTAVKTTSSMIQIPHVAHMEEIDVTDLEDLRRAHNKKESTSVKLTLMGFVIRALASLLRRYPAFNASVDLEKMEIVYKKFYHIGFAADTPKGLMVPVIKDADKKDVNQIASDIRGLAEKGRQGAIELVDLTNGTFTVTNVGAIGGTGVVPTINLPETGILGMGRVEKKPVVKDDEIVIRKILPVTLSFDHRVADGAQAARFVSELKQMLEDPFAFMTGI